MSDLIKNFWETHQAMFYSVMKKYRLRMNADELKYLAMYSIWKAMEHHVPEKSKLETYVYTVFWRECYKYKKRKRHVSLPEDFDIPEVIDNLIEHQEEYQHIKNTANHEDWKLVYNRVVEGKKLKELANNLNVTEQAIHCRIKHILRKWKKHYETRSSLRK